MKSKLTAAIGIAALLFLLFVTPIQAQIGDRDVVPGIESVTGQIARLPVQGSVLEGELSDNSRAFIFIERENFELTENIRVNISSPGEYDSLDDATSSTIASGTVINSYWLHFDPTGFSPSLPGVEGVIRFEQDVLGLIVSETTLDATTPEVGAPGTRYGNEVGVRFLNETLNLSNNRRNLRFDFNNNARFVQLRIITRGTAEDSGGPASGTPTARADSASTRTNDSVTIDVLDNDTDPENSFDNVTLRVISGPSDGSVSLDRDAGEITYDPDNNFTGTDSFTYEICDTTDRCDTATVTVTVSDSGGGSDDPAAPNARSDSETTEENRSITIDVLDNDTDDNNNIDRDRLRVISGPDDGTTEVDRDAGEITYDPDNNFTGSDSFVYEICDTTDRCDTATVRITVEEMGSGGGSGGDDDDDGDLTLRTLLPEADDCSSDDEARIDIVPGNRSNVIRMDDETGYTAVAILSTVHFPAPNCVDVSTITFGPTGDEQSAVSCGVANANFDRWDDVVCDFKTSQLDFMRDDDTGRLEADVIDGGFISEEDDVEVLGTRRFSSRIPSDAGSQFDVISQQIGRNLFVRATGADVARVTMQVFNSKGQLVALDAAGGSLLRWNMMSGTGALLANGVYIYVVTALDAEGQVIGRAINKIALVR